jgi:arylsulfatase A-like enzyme
MCSPTRATLLTGRYGFRTGIGWIIDNDVTMLPLPEITIPEALDLAGSGYQKAALGKWHLGRMWEGLNPVLQGFDLFFGTKGNTASYFEFSRHVAWPYVNLTLDFTGYATTLTTDNAIAYVTTAREPWFLDLNYHAPHEPFHVPPEDLHTQTVFEEPLDYIKAMLEALDTELGRLMEELDLRDTTVILVSDNGTDGDAYPGQSSNKSTLLEGGVNVPMIVFGAAVPRHSRGKVCPALVNSTDVYRTVLELAGVDVDEVQPADQVLDSVSFLPCLADPENAVIRDWVYAEKLQPVTGPPWDRAHKRMICDGRYKLIWDELDPLRTAFYDLSEAGPGQDGESLCALMCPGGLGPAEREAYDRLVAILETLR